MTHRTANKAIALYLFFTAVMGLIICYLFIVTVVHRDFFTSLAQRQQCMQITSHPPRGAIYDRHGALLATNIASVSAFLVPTSIKQKKKLQTFLQQHFPQAAKRLASGNYKKFMYIKRRLTADEQAIITQAAIEDIHLIDEPCRFYPFEALSTVLGMTDIDNKGLFGLELMHNQQLAGKPTIQTITKDARSDKWHVAQETIERGSQPVPLYTTLDAQLQFIVQQELAATAIQYQARQLSALIMDPTTGDIIVMANYPAINPNNTQQFIAADANNRIVTQTFELGSVMKTFAALAAIAEGVVTQEELIDCQDKEAGVVDGMIVHTVPQSVAGCIPFWQVLQKSNNIGIATVAQRVGKKLYDHYRALGFGKKTGLDYLGEQAGHVTHPSTWSKRSLISLSFGYELRATILQLARAFATMANNGYLITPRLTTTTTIKKDGPLYTPTVITTMQELLTLSGAKAALAGYTIMGKTGTANMLIDGVYNKSINLYTFAGIVMHGNYKRVIVTFVNQIKQQGLLASTIALPLFTAIASRMVIHDGIIA
ncbi:penicillin-binding protein 2 [Candidatus Dependentiae bacterium]|nr:penicillin-binding protein 2 [Candidatus Dependentiae bacterium]